jgi:Transposase DDE domain
MKYHVRNWSQYNKSLIQRGSITLWISEDVIKHWYERKENTGERGRPLTYSALAIETCAVLRALHNLSLRSCQGFISSLLELLKINLRTPSYTQVCRRLKTLELKLKYHVKGAVHVVIDGTGLKVFGEGEWKVRQQGYSKHRMWRKLHIGIDTKSKEILMMELTDNHIGENKLFEPLLDQYAGGYTTIGADKGYDSYACHETVGKRGAKSAILVQRKARVRRHGSTREPPLVRDEIVRRMREIGRNDWKAEVGYHRRSLVENTFFRYKTLFGGKLRSHCMENQKQEALICCNILNQFTQLGMPESIMI